MNKIVWNIFFITCTLSSIYSKEPTRNAHMTIFVHGTVKPPDFSFSTLLKIMKDRIDNTLYSKAAQYLREDTNFYCSQAVQERGLKPIKKTDDGKVATSRTIAKLYDIQLEKLGKKPQNHLYYTFGWNGLLSDTKRYQEAEFFYGELINELKFLAQHKLYPTIEIIAYSHGGNVALYLPEVHHTHPTYRHHPITVDRLVLLGTPIQPETDHLACSSCFKSIYHCYSTEDDVQTFDLFTSQKLFPLRIFKSRKKVKFPHHVRNIRVRITKDIKFRHKAQPTKHPHEILTDSAVRLIHKDSGHTELWNFKWGAYWYRDTFPLKPLPVMVFLPTFIDAFEQYPEYQNLTLDFAPSENGILLTNKSKGFKVALPFLDKKTQDFLWQFAEQHTPKDCGIEHQQQRVENALQKAKKDLEGADLYQKPHNKFLLSYVKDDSYHNFFKGGATEFKKTGRSYLAYQ